MSDLPTCTIQHPACGACYGETDHDGDSFYCDDCDLNYGDGDEYEPATYRDEEAEPCAKPCENTWHKNLSFNMACEPCKLPTGHKSMCWTNCKDTPAPSPAPLTTGTP